MAITPDGSTLVVGAKRWLDGQTLSSGAVLVFRWDSEARMWIEAAKLYTPDGAGQGFGHAVAIDAAKTIVIGAPGDSTRGRDSGAVDDRVLVPHQPLQRRGSCRG